MQDDVAVFFSCARIVVFHDTTFERGGFYEGELRGNALSPEQIREGIRDAAVRAESAGRVCWSKSEEEDFAPPTVGRFQEFLTKLGFKTVDVSSPDDPWAGASEAPLQSQWRRFVEPLQEQGVELIMVPLPRVC